MESLSIIWQQLHFSGNTLADLVFALAALMALIFSLVLFFHWRKYGMGGKVLATMEVFYLVGVVLFLATAFLALNAAL